MGGGPYDCGGGPPPNPGGGPGGKLPFAENGGAAPFAFGPPLGENGGGPGGW